MKRVIIVPRNGYVNRLQALVSARLLSDQLGATLHAVWEPESVAPASWKSIFDATDPPALFEDPNILSGLGISLSHGATGLSDPSKFTVFLAGGMAGEQHYMPALKARLKGDCQQLVIVAGGKFTLHGPSVLSPDASRIFSAERRGIYRGINFNSAIRELVGDGLHNNPDPFLALHLRYSDRNIQAPSRRQIRRAVRGAVDAGLMKAFLASDTPKQLSEWQAVLIELGFDTWALGQSQAPRSEAQGAVRALADWLVLGEASYLVYFASSSFGEEAAACLVGGQAVPLETSSMRKWGIHAATLVEAAVTYPQRHWMRRG